MATCRRRKKPLTIELLCREAATFARIESTFPEPTLFGVTDGKAIGTYLEHKFRHSLQVKYDLAAANSASGVDFPELPVDMKVTATSQPQSSCPFKSARQKIFGLGYGLLVFVYEKRDEPMSRTAILDIQHTIFVNRKQTGDFTMTRMLRQHLEPGANAEELVAFMHDKSLPVDEIEAFKIAEELLVKPCEQGFLTISNALQWRLQYGRALEKAGEVDGILRLK